MLSETNQAKLDNFQDMANADSMKHLPRYIEKLLTEIYVYGNAKLSHKYEHFREQKLLIKIGLLTIKDKKTLVLTEQGKALCKQCLKSRRKSGLLLLIDNSLMDICKVFFVCLIVFFILDLSFQNTLTGDYLMIFWVLTFFNLIAHMIVDIVGFSYINEIKMPNLINNLKQYCTNDYQKEFKEFIDDLTCNF